MNYVDSEQSVCSDSQFLMTQEKVPERSLSGRLFCVTERICDKNVRKT